MSINSQIFDRHDATFEEYAQLRPSKCCANAFGTSRVIMFTVSVFWILFSLLAYSILLTYGKVIFMNKESTLTELDIYFGCSAIYYTFTIMLTFIGALALGIFL